MIIPMLRVRRRFYQICVDGSLPGRTGVNEFLDVVSGDAPNGQASKTDECMAEDQLVSFLPKVQLPLLIHLGLHLILDLFVYDFHQLLVHSDQLWSVVFRH